jgi:ATP-binding cassette subfamily C (CFTR/MRP) protein 1
MFALMVDSKPRYQQHGAKMLWISLYIWISLSFFYIDSLLLATLGLILVTSSIYAHLVDPYVHHRYIPSREYLCGIFSYVTFQHINDLIKLSRSRAVEIEDVPTLAEPDATGPLYETFKQKPTDLPSVSASRDPSDYIFTPLFLRLWRLLKVDIMKYFFFQLVASTVEVMPILGMMKVLEHVHKSSEHNERANGESEHIISLVSLHAAVLCLFLGMVLFGIFFNQGLVTGRHMGIRLRGVLCTDIFNKLLRINPAMTGVSLGTIFNLISVDSETLQEFLCYCPAPVWALYYEMFIYLFVLYLVIDIAAISGIVMLILLIPFGVYLGDLVKVHQKLLMVAKDERLSVINEVIDAIKVIKLFSWESQYHAKIKAAREVEIQELKIYSFLRAALDTCSNVAPVLATLVTFLVHTQVLQRPLGTSTGFTVLIVFDYLKWRLSMIPEYAVFMLRAKVSLDRIEKFLDLEEVDKLEFQNTDGVVMQAVSTHDSSHISRAIICDHVVFRWGQNSSFDDVVQTDTESVFDTMKKLMYCDPSRLNICGISAASSSVNADDEGDVEMPLLGEEWQKNEKIKGAGQLTNLKSTQNGGALSANFEVPSGALAIVVGLTGSGKSTLLNGLLNECSRTGGNYRLSGSVSYASQTTWIRNATIRDNILFGEPYDKTWFWTVVADCALLPDLEVLPHGIDTEIGENGINLSGGQQQRLCLARAAYARADIFILDDILSAVDGKTAHHIFHNLLLGSLADRTRIVVTNAVSFLNHADLVIAVDAGEVYTCCAPDQVDSALFLNAKMLNPERQSSLVRLHEILASAMNDRSGSTSSSDLSSLVSAPGRQELLQPILSVIQEQRTGTSNSVWQEEQYINGETGKNDEGEGKSTHVLVRKEEKAEGGISLKTCWFYIRACSTVGIITLVLLQFFLIYSNFLQTYYMGHWLSSMEMSSDRTKMEYFPQYLFWSIAVVCTEAAVAIVRAIVNVRASRTIHENFVTAILRGSFSFFDSTPKGR